MCTCTRVCTHPNISSCNPLGHLEHSLHYGRVHDSKGKKIPDGNYNKGHLILEVGGQLVSAKGQSE